jgi:hypothetical protein
LIVKIDTEGAELDVLRGLGHAASQCEVIIAEAHVYKRYPGGATASTIISLCSELGFELFDTYDSFYTENSVLLMTNLVFIRRDNPRWQLGIRGKSGLTGQQS